MNDLAVLFELIAIVFVGGVGFGFALAKYLDKMNFKSLQRQIDSLQQRGNMTETFFVRSVVFEFMRYADQNHLLDTDMWDFDVAEKFAEQYVYGEEGDGE
jgi:hypothetical protein